MSNNQVVNMESPFQMVRHSNIFEDTSPYMINLEGRDQIKSPKSDSKKSSIKSYQSKTEKSEEDDQSSRKDQHLLLYILNAIVTFCISFQNVVLVFTTNEQSKGFMSISIVISTICVSMITTYQLSKNKWKIFNIYILLDNIFLTEVASCFGFIGFLLLINEGYWYQVITMVAFPLEIVFFVGNFRIMLINVRWPKWRVILFKLILLADAAVFFQIGAYYMSNDYLYTGGYNDQLDGRIKDFVLLYIFGLFALFVELYAKMCDIDQTADLKFDYQLKQMEEEKKIQKIRNSVMGFNQEVEKARSRFLNEAKKKDIIEPKDLPKI